MDNIRKKMQSLKVWPNFYTFDKDFDCAFDLDFDCDFDFDLDFD